MRGKNTDIKKAVSTKGTCKDMCPEKERVMREARCQVTNFESNQTDHYGIDPRKAIKQYSRSSADQEVPLPHELRPEAVLKTTMTYLLHNIIDLCDDPQTNTSLWFQFVWDRTRSIRKDITQQELCSTGTVELVEQCVRFHIHCSARLVAEDPSVFDQKINTENLTKCLQTLKYMYNDLKLKKVSCVNEAEFRAYIVLLNLNGGNFLWEIKQLEKRLIDSKEIRFALQVYFAIENSNYVRFFKLVKETTYMNACVLLRYFNQIRLKAIQITIRSYAPRKGGFNYSISYLTNVLAFQDDDITANYLNYHGLMCERDNDSVYLDRMNFEYPDSPYAMERAIDVVESKRQCSVAEAVCGSTLDSIESFLYHVPHCSFDNDGFLKRDAYSAEDQNGVNARSSVNLVKENVFKIPKVSPPVSPASSIASRLGQKVDKTDGIAKTNFFAQISTNPFAPQPATTKIFGSPSSTNIFGGFNSSQSNKATTTPVNSPSFGSPIAPANTHIQTGNTFASSPSNSTFGNFDNSSVFGSTIPPVVQQSKNVFGQQSPLTNNISSFLSSFVQPIVKQQLPGTQGGFSFQAMEQEAQLEAAKKQKEQEELQAKLKRDEMERMRCEQELRDEEQKLREDILKEQLWIQTKKRQEEERLAEEDKILDEQSETVLSSLISEIVVEKANQEVEEAIKLYVEVPKEFYKVLEADVIDEQLCKIYRQEFLAYVNQMKLKYTVLQKYFIQWRNNVEVGVARRNKIASIGSWVPNESLEEQIEELLHPKQRQSLSNMKQYLSGSPQTIKLPNLEKCEQIDLFQSLSFKNIESSNKIYWKLLISLPHKCQENCPGFSSFIDKWIKKTIAGSSRETNAFFLEEQFVRQTRKKLAICVRKLQGTQMLDETENSSNDVLNNSHSLLFFMTTTNMEKSHERLLKIINSLEMPVPVSVIVYKNKEDDDEEVKIAKYFDLSSEVNVSNYEIVFYYEFHEKDKNLTQVTLESICFLNDYYMKYLLEKNFELFDLEQQHMLDFYQILLGDEMWQHVEISCRQNDSFRKQMKSFNNTIELFNTFTGRLMEMISNDYRNLLSLPQEFRKNLPPPIQKIPLSYEYFPVDWQSSEWQKKQICFIQKLKLTKMADDQFQSFNDFKQKLYEFIGQNFRENHSKIGHNVVERFINILYRQELISEEDVTDSIVNFNWLNILGEIVVTKFNEVYQDTLNTEQLPSAIIYNKTKYQLYRNVPWWYSIKFVVKPNVIVPLTSSVEPELKKLKMTLPSSEDFENILAKSAKSLNKISARIDNFKEMSSKTRELSRSFDKTLYNYGENLQSMKRTWDFKFNNKL